MNTSKSNQAPSENDEASEEDELYKSCLTEDEAKYGQFVEPGGVLGFGLGVAKQAGLKEKSGEEKDEFLQPVLEASEQFWEKGNKSLNREDVIKVMVSSYGCKPVKDFIDRAKSKADKERKRREWERKWKTKNGV